MYLQCFCLFFKLIEWNFHLKKMALNLKNIILALLNKRFFQFIQKCIGKYCAHYKHRQLKNNQFFTSLFAKQKYSHLLLKIQVNQLFYEFHEQISMIRLIQIYKVNRLMEGPEFGRQQQQRNKHIIFILCVYALLLLSAHFTTDYVPFSQTIINIMKHENMADLELKDMMSLFKGKNYQGKWTARDPNQHKVLTHDEGRFTFSIDKKPNNQTINYGIELKINNGRYIDDGCVTLRTMLKQREWDVEASDNWAKAYHSAQKPLYAHYKHKKLLKTQDEKLIPLFTLTFTLTQNNNSFGMSIHLVSQEKQVETLDLMIEGQQAKLFHFVVFAILLFFVAYFQFSAIMELLQNIIEDGSSASVYSLVTIIIATMWDSIMCIIAFVCAFENEENLILFIMPAFLLCLLFTNLEIRFMYLIYEARGEHRPGIWKFNLLTYGSLGLIYPIIIFTNFDEFMMPIMSLLLLPQIYTNAIEGTRPDIGSAYYSKFLLSRFLILLYVKAFPWNIFQLQPNYSLACICVSLLLLQLILLWYQRQYGPKTTVPSLFLPRLYDYQYSDPFAPDDECAICLNKLGSESGTQHHVSAVIVGQNLMQTPCGHIYHAMCLLKWMQMKMECPNCRAKLPPFQ